MEVAPRYKLLRLLKHCLDSIHCTAYTAFTADTAECSHKGLKNITHNGLWELYAVSRMGRIDGTP